MRFIRVSRYIFNALPILCVFETHLSEAYSHFISVRCVANALISNGMATMVLNITDRTFLMSLIRNVSDVCKFKLNGGKLWINFGFSWNTVKN